MNGNPSRYSSAQSPIILMKHILRMWTAGKVRYRVEKLFLRDFFQLNFYSKVLPQQKDSCSHKQVSKELVSLTKLVYPSLLQSKVKKAHNQQKSSQIDEKVRSISFWFHKCKAQVLGTGFSCRTREAQCKGLAATTFCRNYSANELRILFLCFIFQLPISHYISHKFIVKEKY